MSGPWQVSRDESYLVINAEPRSLCSHSDVSCPLIHLVLPEVPPSWGARHGMAVLSRLVEGAEGQRYPGSVVWRSSAGSWDGVVSNSS